MVSNSLDLDDESTTPEEDLDELIDVLLATQERIEELEVETRANNQAN